jgi:hypothetical protein
VGDDARRALARGTTELSIALRDTQVFLGERLPLATDDFALGEARFLAALETQGVRKDLAALRALADRTLARDLAALEAEARRIDPTKPVRDVVDALPKPPADGVLGEARRQAADMRRWLVDRAVVSIPSDDVAEVRETPPYMRWNFAFLDSGGPFERAAVPAFYFITPPDPTWPREQQLGYIPPTSGLLFTTVHEVWPGHFLHGLHIKKNESRVLRSFCTYSTSEGWAHYTEEMMWRSGVGAGDPRAHIGQLLEALLRDVRFVSAIGLHTGGMTVTQSAALFRDKAMVDEMTAEQQARRGTFDPLYLSYTIGKLMIMKLHDDWQRKAGKAYSLRAFHDELLSYACLPLPVIRREMLGAGAGPEL